MMGVKHGKIQNHTFMPGPYWIYFHKYFYIALIAGILKLEKVLIVDICQSVRPSVCLSDCRKKIKFL